MWRIERECDQKARAIAQEGATIENLSLAIELDLSEWKKWLTHYGSIRTIDGDLPIEQVEPGTLILPGERVYIPNSIIAYWAGELGSFGRLWVHWHYNRDIFRNRGFFVQEKEGLNGREFNYVIRAATKEKELAGVYFWGHGHPSFLLTDASRDGDYSFWSFYESWNEGYNLPVGLLCACYTEKAKWWGKFSGASAFWGSEGKLIPWPFHLFGPTAGELIPPGRQGTKMDTGDEEKISGFDKRETLLDQYRSNGLRFIGFDTPPATADDEEQDDQEEWHTNICRYVAQVFTQDISPSMRETANIENTISRPDQILEGSAFIDNILPSDYKNLIVADIIDRYIRDTEVNEDNDQILRKVRGAQIWLYFEADRFQKPLFEDICFLNYFCVIIENMVVSWGVYC
ncbi:MAG: hypothetical protein JRJ47_09395 [Deltaproteobacteria bacterium]|nr:hypothetical protein [Deltaproteobacteria bacterium]